MTSLTRRTRGSLTQLRPTLDWAWVAVAIFLLGSVLSWLAAERLEREGQRGIERRLTQQMDLLAADMGRRFEAEQEVLKDLSAVHGALGGFNRDSFRAYWSARGLGDFPGVRGFGVIRHVLRKDLPAFEAQQRRLTPGFQVHTQGDADDLFVVVAVEPATRNVQALGLDIGGEPVRRATARNAIRSAQPTLTRVINLVQDQRSQPAFLMLAPLYKGSGTPDPADRWEQRNGFVYSAIVAEDLLRPIGGLTQDQLDVVVEAPSATGSPAIVFDTRQFPEGGEGLHEPLFTRAVTRQVAGQPLTLKIMSRAGFESGLNLNQGIYTGLIGTLLSALVALSFWLVAQGRQRAERLAERWAGEARQLATIAERTSDAIVVCDPDGQVTWVNAAFTLISGYSLDDLRGKKPGEVLQCAETDAETVAQVSACVRKRQTCHVDIENRSKAGHRYWLHMEIQPLYRPDGSFEGYMSVQRDITATREQHQRELDQAERLSKALRDAEALMATINAHAIVSESGRDGRITRVNEAFTRISGYTAQELLGQDHRIVNSGVHPHEFWTDMWRVVASGRPWRAQVCNRRKDGSFYWVDSIVAPFMDSNGRVERYVSIRFDISEARRAQGELQRERERLQTILEGTRVGTWRVNVLTGENQVDDRWAAMLGYQREELTPLRAEMWQAMLNPEDEELARQQLRDYLEGRSEIYEVERRMRHKSGRWIWILSRGTAVARLPDGRIEWMAGTHMDVTERHRLYEQAEHRSNLITAILENMPGGLCAFDADLQLLVRNQQFAQMFNMPASLFAEPSVTYEDLIRYEAQRGEFGNDSVEAIVGRAVDLVRASGANTFERVRPNGQTLEVRVNPMKGGGVVMTILDITRRKLAEGEARRSEETLRQAINALDEAFVIFDASDRLLLCNQRYLDTYPLTAPMLKPGLSFEEAIRYGAAHGEYAGAVGRIDEWVAERMAQHRRGDTDLVQELGDGRYLRVVERKTADGLTVGFRIDVTDLIRARNAAEEATRTAQQAVARLKAVYDVVPVGLTVKDEQGRVIDSNPAAARLLGLQVPGGDTPADLPWPQLREDGSPLPPEEAPGQVAWREQRVVRDTLVQVVGPRGREWLSVSAMPARSAGLGVVVAYVDVTHEHQQQQALLEAKRVAEEASQAKSQFLANMSHEIRTPMNAILGMLQLLSGTELQPRQREYTEKTQNAARSLLGLLNGILDFSKVEAGKMTLEAAPMHFDEIMRDLSVILASNTGAKPVEVLFDIDPQVPAMLIGDSLRLKQILINLGANAIKFTPEGLVVLRVVVMGRQAGRVALGFSVLDTGIGIAPENMHRIFEGFSQAEASTTRRFGGTGLGLVISSRLVGLMGGQLQVESQPGQGSRFYFVLSLPVADDASCIVEPPAESADHGLRVLVVDDNAQVRTVMRQMIEAMGWQVVEAASGEEALQLCDDAAARGSGRAFDAVFVDGQMPGMGGWQAALALRDRMPDRRVPVVVTVTALGREMLGSRPPQEQARLDGFLVKPVTPSMVLDAVMEARHGGAGVRASPARAAGAPRRLRGMRLLVVEDNAINQQVAQELLQREGAHVTLADNGQLGVDAIRNAAVPWDAVLMDVQMPVMDGYTATRVVREELGQRQLPIVAMTANASQRDRQEALGAGMDDHVGKPFELDSLVAVLLRLAPQGVREETAGEGEGDAVPDPAPERESGTRTELPAPSIHLDLPTALDRLRQDTVLWSRVAESFAGHLPEFGHELTQFLKDGQMLEAQRLLHTLKGTASTVGARLLAILAADAEDQVRAAPPPSPAQADAWLAPLLAALEQTQVELSEALKAVAGPPTESAGTLPGLSGLTPAERADLERDLHELAGLLQAEDYACLDVYASLRDRYEGRLGPDLVPLDEAMSSLDFEAAGHACMALRG